MLLQLEIGVRINVLFGSALTACKKQSGGVLAWLSVCLLAPVKSRLVLPFWYRLTQVVLEKRPLKVVVVGRAFNQSYAVRKFRYLQNNGTSLWN